MTHEGHVFPDEGVKCSTVRTFVKPNAAHIVRSYYVLLYLLLLRVLALIPTNVPLRVPNSVWFSGGRCGSRFVGNLTHEGDVFPDEGVKCSTVRTIVKPNAAHVIRSYYVLLPRNYYSLRYRSYRWSNSRGQNLSSVIPFRVPTVFSFEQCTPV